MNESARGCDRAMPGPTLSRFGRACLFCLGLGAAPSLLAASSATTQDLSASVRFDDNQSNSIVSRDREADEVLRLEARLYRPPRREVVNRVAFDAALGFERFGDFRDLDRVDLAAGARLSLVPGSGYGAPSFDLGLRGALLRHRDSEIRDGARLTVFARSALRLTDRLSAATDLAYTHRTATDGEVFDTRVTRLSVLADLSLPGRQLLWFEAWGTLGDLTANVATSESRLRPVAEAFEVDPAFGPGLLVPGPGGWPVPAPGPGPGDRFAYRLDGTSLAFEAGWGRMLGALTTLEASIGYRRAYADDGIRYDALTGAISLVRRLR